MYHVNTRGIGALTREAVIWEVVTSVIEVHENHIVSPTGQLGRLPPQDFLPGLPLGKYYCVIWGPD